MYYGDNFELIENSIGKLRIREIWPNTDEYPVWVFEAVGDVITIMRIPTTWGSGIGSLTSTTIDVDNLVGCD